MPCNTIVSLSLLSQQKTPTTKCLSSCVLFQAKTEVTLPGEGLTSLRRRLKETASAVTFSFITKMKMGKKETADVFRKDRDQLWLGNWNLNSLDIQVNIQESIVFWKYDLSILMGLFLVKMLSDKWAWLFWEPVCTVRRGKLGIGDVKFAGSNYWLHISAVVQNERSYWQCSLSLVLKFDWFADQVESKNLLPVGKKTNLRSQTKFCLGHLEVTKLQRLIFFLLIFQLVEMFI